MNSAALTALYRSHAAQTRARVRTNVLGTFDRLTGIDDATAETFASRAAALMAAGQRVVAHQTVAYMRLIARAEVGTPFEAPQLLPTLGDRIAIVRPGQAIAATPLQRVYMKPFFELWQRLAKGQHRDDALLGARTALERNVATDLALIARNVAHVIVQHDDRIAGWRRATSGACCARCSSAAGQLFHRDDPMPLHPSDTCFVRPVYHADEQAIRTEAIDSPDFGPTFKELAHA